MIPQCYPHLQIAGSTIIQDLQESLWHAANIPDYHDYMRKKHNWTELDCVNWTALKLALCHVPWQDRPHLHKFLHNWLPFLGAHHNQQPEQTTTAPCADANWKHFGISLSAIHNAWPCTTLWYFTLPNGLIHIYFRCYGKGSTQYTINTPLMTNLTAAQCTVMNCFISYVALVGTSCSMAILPMHRPITLITTANIEPAELSSTPESYETISLHPGNFRTKLCILLPQCWRMTSGPRTQGSTHIPNNQTRSHILWLQTQCHYWAGPCLLYTCHSLLYSHRQSTHPNTHTSSKATGQTSH